MKKVLSVLACSLLLLTACSDDKGKETSKLTQFKTLYSGEIKTLNYLKTAETNEFAAAANLVDGLIEYDKYGIVKPGIATEWSSNEDATVWTFKLRDDVKWLTNDGKEYADTQAQDFVDALAYVLDSKNESATSWIAYAVKNGEKFYNGEVTDFSQVGVKAVDKYTLEYTLESPTPYFLSMLNYVCFFPANGKFLSEKGSDFGTTKENLLYNGSYLLDKFEPQNERVLVKNEKYWDKENIHIDRLRYKYNKEAASVAPELFLRGEIDSASIPSSVIDEWFKDSEKKTKIRQSQNNFYTYFYAFNFDPKFDKQYEPENWKKAVNNVDFRKSIFHALDRKSAMMTQEPYNPESILSNTITPKNFVDVAGTDYTQLGGLASVSNTDSFNVEVAKQHKEKAMKELNGKATFPVKILMPYNSSMPDWANRSQVIEQQLETALGNDYVDVIIEAGPATGFLSSVRHTGKYALLEANWGPDYADPSTYTAPFTEGGTYNKPELAEGYVDANGKKTYTNLVEAANAENTDIAKRYNLYAEAESFLINESFVIPYAVGGNGYVASKLNPFEAQYSPFGVTAEKFKGQKVLKEPMSNDEFTAALEKWEKERAEALSKVAK